MSSLPNGDFAFGESGWTVLAHNATGVTWSVEDGALVIDGSAGASGPAGSLVVFSPRRAATAGEWTADATVTCSPPALVDVALVAGEVVPVPGPAPTPAPYELAEVSDTPVTIRATRVLEDAARTVGLRVRAPSGCRLVVCGAEVRPSDAPTSTPTTVAFRGARSPFREGALLGRGERAEIEVGVRGRGSSRLTVRLEDRYRGKSQVVLDTCVDLTAEPSWQPVSIPTGANGCYALVAELLTDEVPGTKAATTEFRFVVDDDKLPLTSGTSPWALTIDTLSLDIEADLLDLLGIRHVRVYSGFSVYDLPAALRVADPLAAAAMVDGLHFTGAAAGSPAAMTARAVSAMEPGRPRSGWPQWRRASAALAAASDADLTPVAGLLDPLRGRTVVAEMSQLDEPAGLRRVARAVAAGARGREITWLASNEPDLWQEGSPEQAAAESLAFAEGVRAGDPSARLVGPALADGWDGGHQGMSGWDWLERWARTGGAEAVDAVSVHLHMLDEETQTPEREQLHERMVALRARLADWCGRPMPLWVTEMGWRSQASSVEVLEPGESGPAVSEADQADLLVRAAASAVAAGVERFYAFHLTGFRPTGEGHRFAWGLLSGHVGGPKPAFAALRRLVRSTAGLQVSAPLLTAERVRAVPFLASGSGRDVHLVWQWSGGCGLWTLTEPPPDVQVLDLMGEPAPGEDLRRVHILSSPMANRHDVQGWLRGRLAARHGEPQHAPMTHQPSMEELHVSTA
jgi:hypothetical protein